MIKSMTGFGSVSIDNEELSLVVEVKSLNSKTLDIYTKLHPQFYDKEVELRNMLGKHLERGKINLIISYTSKRAQTEQAVVNKPLVARYYADLLETSQMLGAPTADLFRIAMMMPNAYIQAMPASSSEEEWKMVSAAVEQAINACNQFRASEGDMMLKMLEQCISELHKLLDLVEQRDPERMLYVRERIRQQVSEFVNSEHFDESRFEQELIYYSDKLDINEEKVRLRNHLNYFYDTLKEPQSNGKKLNFISQEMGREINTLGAKAYDVEIQRTVVRMKEELEKIKEQLGNVL